MLSQLLGGLGHIQALQFTGMGGLWVYMKAMTRTRHVPTNPSLRLSRLAASPSRLAELALRTNTADAYCPTVPAVSLL